ncbi:MAG TPA: alpha/beta hydrolase fold domain-containing protein, partial [Candidatus Ozemobacteraceae bacterium]|nr:alpha/beta hydrolase fold domain-containing protein [Candidatus Ozemobacteraceae bacterium]
MFGGHLARRVLVVAFCLLAILCAAENAKVAGALPTPPGPPALGPGAPVYPHGRTERIWQGKGEEAFLIAMPADPAPASAPLVVLLHGWLGINPNGQGAWIEHLARRGNIVVWLVYQTGRMQVREPVSHAVAALKQALAELEKPGRVKPRPEGMVLAGHSLGGCMAMNLAAVAARNALPRPLAVLSVEGGDARGSESAQRLHLNPKSIIEDLSRIPSGTMLLTLIGEDDERVTLERGRVFHDRATAVASADNVIALVSSDRHGEPPMIADHFFPSAFDASYDINGKTGQPTPQPRFPKLQKLVGKAFSRLLGVPAMAERAMLPPNALDW